MRLTYLLCIKRLFVWLFVQKGAHDEIRKQTIEEARGQSIGEPVP